MRLLDEYSTAYAGNQFRAVRRFLRWLAIEEDRPDPVKGLRVPAVKVKLVPVFTSEDIGAAAGMPGQELRGPAGRPDPGRVRGDWHPALGAGRHPPRPGRPGWRRPGKRAANNPAPPPGRLNQGKHSGDGQLFLQLRTTST